MPNSAITACVGPQCNDICCLYQEHSLLMFLYWKYLYIVLGHGFYLFILKKVNYSFHI